MSSLAVCGWLNCNLVLSWTIKSVVIINCYVALESVARACAFWESVEAHLTRAACWKHTLFKEESLHLLLDLT